MFFRFVDAADTLRDLNDRGSIVVRVRAALTGWNRSYRPSEIVLQNYFRA